MDIVAEARRRAFSLWLRTGRLPAWLKPANAEVKFNPWHDPDDGRFTFAGTGRYFGRGSGGGAGRDNGVQAHSDRRRTRASRGAGQFGGGGRGPKETEGFEPGGGGFAGGGATGSWDPPSPKPAAKPARRQQPRTDQEAGTATRPGAARGANQRANSEANWRRVKRNGYEWSFDSNDLFREVDGTLTLSNSPRRSRTAQRQAGGPDRRPNDDGGHYIAPRFNGPMEAFNHFAQNANFNRGRYRLLEDQWAKALRASKRVRVRIVPVYEGSSRRPSYLNVWFWIDGKRQSLQLPNERSEKPNAKR